MSLRIRTRPELFEHAEGLCVLPEKYRGCFSRLHDCGNLFESVLPLFPHDFPSEGLNAKRAKTFISGIQRGGEISGFCTKKNFSSSILWEKAEGLPGKAENTEKCPLSPVAKEDIYRFLAPRRGLEPRT